MKVLIACEESQVVCKAFRQRGHEAYSNDIIECSGGHPEWHIQGDILEILKVYNFLKSFDTTSLCAKQTTIAVIVNGDKAWIGSNWCENPQRECPRKGMPTGVGYDLCKSICRQPNHAEVDACLKAGEGARGATLYLVGHSYCCELCKRVMENFGIKNIQILPSVKGWDLMIAHPPCTRLCNSGVSWLERRNLWKEMEKAAEFFKALLDAKIPRKAVENPIPHKYALKIIGRKYDQIIQPWMFGHPETKATCLWLKNLPPLMPTDLRFGREQRLHKLPPSPDRARLRSTTYQGIADAFAEQYGRETSKERVA